MERVEEHLGVDKEVSSFVLPVGATINMDGTSLYQAVAAVFIAQALDFDLTFTDQLMIVLTALLASIGSAAVPGAGMVMLVIVLESVGFPADKLAIGLALIFAVDRPLDMCPYHGKCHRGCHRFHDCRKTRREASRSKIKRMG